MAGGKENLQNAGPPAPVPAPKPGTKKRALAATGQLGFNLTTWFAGAVNVVVDGKGAVTVIGKIAPPAEIKLFDQKDWDKEIVSFEAKAYYGLPVVGNLNLFANITLHVLANSRAREDLQYRDSRDLFDRSRSAEEHPDFRLNQHLGLRRTASVWSSSLIRPGS